MIAWYLCPYNHKKGGVAGAVATRWCAIKDFDKEIKNQGGSWSAIEVEGNQAIVKVETTDTVIIKLDQTFQRLSDDFDKDISEKSQYYKPRRAPRYDDNTNTIICDGKIEELPSIDSMNKG